MAGALGERYESLCGVAVPVGKKTTTPAKDAFLYLLSFLTLATWTISLGSICYASRDDWIRDPLTRQAHAEISTELACLLVTFPLYLFHAGDPVPRAPYFFNY
jgi:hypothetical protein